MEILMRRLHLVIEPTGETYAQLIDFAIASAAYFSLVWRRRGLGAGRSIAPSLRDDLQAVLECETDCNDWPGTSTGGSIDPDGECAAQVRVYRASALSRKWLLEPKSLYGWRHERRLPEDIAFFSEDRRCWLFTVAHESLGFMEPSIADTDLALRAVPGLVVKPIDDTGFMFYTRLGP
jgi:hypothetical protein